VGQVEDLPLAKATGVAFHDRGKLALVRTGTLNLRKECHGDLHIKDA
jgi:hypothetical protein